MCGRQDTASGGRTTPSESGVGAALSAAGGVGWGVLLSAGGVGDALVPMLLVCIGTCVLRVTWIFTVGTFDHDLMVTLVSYPLSWSVTSIAFLIYYYRFSAIRKLTKLQKRSAK